MRNRTFWTYNAADVDDVLDDVLGGQKTIRVWFCVRCGTFHAEGLEVAFREHYRGEKIKEVAATDVADYRQLEHQEDAGR